MLVDIHCHLHEYSEDYIARLIEKYKDIVIVAVSDDYESSIRTISLARKYPDKIIPCVGLHPWEVKEDRNSVEEAEKIARLALKEGVKCFGEVGLDTKFVPETIEVQRKVFDVFVKAALDTGGFLNIHAAGTWEEVVSVIGSLRRPVVFNIHWYTGPLHLLTRIRDLGGFISINPALRIQHKHREVVRYAPLDMILTESDGPYEYRGLKLGPELIPETLRLIANIKGVEEDAVTEAVWSNFIVLRRRVGL